MSKWLDIRDLLRFEASADGTSASLIAVERHGEPIPMLISALLKVAVSAASAICVDSINSHPPPNANPLTAAIMGFAKDSTRRVI